MPNNGLWTINGPLALQNVSLSLPGTAATPWQLPAGHFKSAKMAMAAVYPRPDAETQATAYCRNAYPGIQYKIPLAVQGGAWPFYYEPITLPSGATLGQMYGDADYGVLKWTPPGSGTHSFHIRVHDQDGNTVDLQWSSTVGTSWALFVDPTNGNDTNAGTLVSPKQTLAGAWSAATGGKHLILRGGTHAMGGTLSLNSTTVIGMIGYPGEVATIDGSAVTGTGNHFWHNGNDNTVQDLQFINTSTSTENPRWFTSMQVTHRLTQAFCTFLNGRAGTATGGGDDNNSCFFLGNPGAVREYVLQSHCHFENLVGTNNGFSAIDTYSCRYALIQHNTYGTPASPSSRHALWIKGGGNTYITVRENRWTQAWTGSGTGGGLVVFALGTDGIGTIPGYQELCYNTIISTNKTTTTDVPAVTIATASQAGLRGPIWLYRNTVVGTYTIARTNIELSDVYIEDEVIVNDCTFYNDISTVMSPQPAYRVSYTWSSDPNNRFRDPALRPLMQQFVMTGIECHGKTTDNVLDSAYRLTGSYRTNWLGKRGAEIYPVRKTWSMTAEAGVIGEIPQGATTGRKYGELAFTSSASRTYYTNEAAYSGVRAFKTGVDAGSTGFGQLGGIFELNTAGIGYLYRGDSIWIRVRLLVPNTYQWNSGRSKFLRLRCYKANGTTSVGYNDLYLGSNTNSNDGAPFSFIFEGEQQWHHFTGPQTDFPGATWTTLELNITFDHLKASQGGNARVRLWRNGVFYGETTERRTLNSATDFIKEFNFFTYFGNETAPQTQHFYFDDLTISREPGQVDSAGRPFIGHIENTKTQ